MTTSVGPEHARPQNDRPPRDREREMEARFAADTANHEMVVLMDAGLHRHLLFKRPNTGSYWFEIVTWPHALTVRGDMGTLVFARTKDMFEFFRGQRVNTVYWAEKEQTGAPLKRFDVEYARRVVLDRVADLADHYEPEDVTSIQEVVTEMVDDYEFAHSQRAAQLISELRVPLRYAAAPFEFYDTWEWDLTEYTAQYLWNCNAIVWAIKHYDEAKIA